MMEGTPRLIGIGILIALQAVGITWGVLALITYLVKRQCVMCEKTCSPILGKSAKRQPGCEGELKVPICRKCRKTYRGAQIYRDGGAYKVEE